jgi:hypothetical protein
MKTQYLYMSKRYHTSLPRTSNCEYGHSSLPGRFSPMFTGCRLMMIMVESHILRFRQCHMQFHIPTTWKVEGLNCGPEKATYGSFGGHSICLDVRFWPSLGCKGVSALTNVSSVLQNSPRTWRLMSRSLLDYSTNWSETLSPLRA